MITDLTFWQNLGALGVGFLVWMGILIAGWWATTVGLAFINKWAAVNKALGWVLLLAMSLGVVWIFWATGVRLLHR